MNLESFISRRYLVSKHKVNFITIISLISILGITIGVAALIVVLSVFNGFGSLVTSYLINFDPHIRVEIISFEASQKPGLLLNRIREIKEVKDFAPFVSGKVLAYRGGLTEVINLKGIPANEGESIYGIQSSIAYGKYFSAKQGELPEIVIGIRLADKLEAIIRDTITLISPVGIERAITQLSMPNMQKFILRGIYNSNNNEYDANYIFTKLTYAQKLLGYNSRIQGYDIRLENINESFKVKEQLQKKLNGRDYSVNTWYDFHKDLYSVMQIERWSAYIILSLIIAVASFNIMGSLSMSVIEKKRDIGVLRAMGTNQKSIVKIFMFEGLLIGIIGTIAGALLGYFVCFLQLKYNIYPLDPTQYKINSLPLEIRVSDFFFISGASMLLSFLASLYPAKRAAKVNAIEAIKWE
ncbi:MAG TPA: ABC transporter permease [Ignavibacteriaceae bacterium]|nr:ABC transporter permease [Ignavibacteriaceae bacterium]